MTDSDVIDHTFVSTADGTRQEALVYCPPTETAVPLVVGLHTWSYDRFNQLEQLLPLCRERGWALVLPEFRGPNLTTNPRVGEAGGSPLAVRDVLDAVACVRAIHPIDPDALFLLGGSGGGQMALLTAAAAPDLWTGVSAWVPITDLAAWHDENPHYAAHVAACCGGAPGASAAVDAAYQQRSPLSYVRELSTVPLSLHHGRFDPVVSYRHGWRLAQALEEAGAKRFFFEIFSGEHDIHYATAFAWFETLAGTTAGGSQRLTG